MLSDKPKRDIGSSKQCVACKWCRHRVRKEQQAPPPPNVNTSNNELEPLHHRAKVRSSLLSWFEKQQKQKSVNFTPGDLPHTIFQQVLLLSIPGFNLDHSDAKDSDSVGQPSQDGSAASNYEQNLQRLLMDDLLADPE